MPSCPECASQKVWKDGLRKTRDGNVQRYLCRRCGYRFSGFKQNRVPQLQVKKYVAFQPFKKLHSRPDFTQIPIRHSDSATKKALNDSSFSICEDVRSHKDPAKSTVGKTINKFLCSSGKRRVCASDGEAKNLVEVETRSEKRAAGATKPDQMETKSQLIELAWWMKKQGYRDSTIILTSKKLKHLVKLGAELLKPESIKDVIAKQKWQESTKTIYVNAYVRLARVCNIPFVKPHYRVNHRKLPFIPTETELDQLIASCGKKLSVFLQLLKETGMRSGEAFQLKWKDLDFATRTVRVNNPGKHSNSRIIKISDKLVAMLKARPQKSNNVFGASIYSMRNNFGIQRKRVADKLKNPRLLRICFHTLRHWKATMEYHKTKDILHVMKLLGHRSINNTLIYTHLVNFDADEYDVKVAETKREITELLEAGFEWVGQDKGGLTYFRKRK